MLLVFFTNNKNVTIKTINTPMALFLVVHPRYNDVQIGLFNNSELVDVVADDNKKISKNFLYLISHLLLDHHTTLQDLSFISAHQGPAPFTTLRVALACVNGLGFATQVPLIGVNGLEAFLREWHFSNQTVTIALLNAFCQELYYGIYNPFDDVLSFGSGRADHILDDISRTYTGHVNVIGNGVPLYSPLINQYFDARVTIPDPLPEMVSLIAIGSEAFKKWQNHQTSHQLMPIYIKRTITPQETCQPTG
jgi:tRNA threonylcarbamoyladenosine biosynthesis protein TsaB